MQVSINEIYHSNKLSNTEARAVVHALVNDKKCSISFLPSTNTFFLHPATEHVS